MNLFLAGLIGYLIARLEFTKLLNIAVTTLQEQQKVLRGIHDNQYKIYELLKKELPE